MLGIDKVVHGREAYYLSTVPTGRGHDGGLVEPDGAWLGAAAASLGLAGAVRAGALRSVMEGRHPATGEVLSRSHERGRVRVAGYDCTFSTPKSLSLLHALGPEEAVDAVGAAHREAVETVVGYLERHAARTRRASPSGPPDRLCLPAEGLVAASFAHRTSRAPDPHLHSHVLVVNCAPGSDGRWSPLDGRALYVEAASAAGLYEAQVRQEVVQRLGLRFCTVRGSSAELDGIDVEILRAFSRRSAEIEEFLARRGWHGPGARRTAAAATREPKDLTTSYEALQVGWRERAIEHGLAVGRLDRLVERGRAQARPDGSRAGEIARGLGPALGATGLTARRASFTRSELLRAACRGAPEGASVAEVERTVDALCGSPALVERGSGRRWLHREGGRSIPAPSAEARFTTPEILDIEASIAEAVRSRQAIGAAVATERSAGAALGCRPLAPAVEVVAERLLRAGHGVEVLRAAEPGDPGRAAVGGVQSDALDAARDGWERDGRQVFGLAPTAPGARRLEATTGVESVPVEALGRTPREVMLSVAALPSGSVLAVGAAERLGPRLTAAVLEGAGLAQAKVVLSAAGRLTGPDDAVLADLAGLHCPGIGTPVPAPFRSPETGALQATWIEAGPALVTFARSAADARQVLIGTWLDYAARDRTAVVVTDDQWTGLALRSAGCAPVVPPRSLAGALANSPGAALVVLGDAGSLPAAVRRNPRIERAHVAIERVGDARRRLGRVEEMALQPRVVREIGAPPRTFEGRSAWRAAADAWRVRELGRESGDRTTVAGGDRAAEALLADALRTLRELRPGRARSLRTGREIGR